MESLLDLRSERCPMALLLAKRYVANLTEGDNVEIYIVDPSSLRDIERYLLMKNHRVTSTQINDYFSLKVVI
ncbi:sulfurtransferase TusA family protein [Vibrio sp. ZSDE26]|uniref:Sulfurtransferase TusA family protein n=1 Tax=Vibrio amylolyticus TaxID=2847292 RepID=A0A9X2BMZ5_9VIBR|nr:sulfurtransferase TusA family protein [Vibrio amylolyticus]